MAKPTVAIIGASADRSKYGNRSVRAHLKRGYEVYPVNPKGGQIEGLRVYRSLHEIPARNLDRISIYVSPQICRNLLPQIAVKGCDELWFNPGSESPEVLAEAIEWGLNPIVACSIVDLGESPSEFDDDPEVESDEGFDAYLAEQVRMA